MVITQLPGEKVHAMYIRLLSQVLSRAKLVPSRQEDNEEEDCLLFDLRLGDKGMAELVVHTEGSALA